jgi:hypothetical protein
VKRAGLVSVAILAGISGGCDSATNEPVASSQPPPARKAVNRPASSDPRSPAGPFLDQKKTVPSRLEWNREVTSKRGVTVAFRVKSRSPFAITIVTDRAMKAMKSGDRNPIDPIGDAAHRGFERPVARGEGHRPRRLIVVHPREPVREAGRVPPSMF